LVILESHFIQKNEWRAKMGLINENNIKPLRSAHELAADD
jgi:hypothetical protein